MEKIGMSSSVSTAQKMYNTIGLGPTATLSGFSEGSCFRSLS